MERRMRGFTSFVLWALLLAAFSVAGAAASIFLLLTRTP
jgi:hypothetical protein